jgi:hypothetical protein
MFLFLALAVCLAAGVEAKTYASFGNGFYFTYPDDWQQVPYSTIDEYLARGNAGRPLYNYDAAFAPDSSDPFFSGEYLIVYVDTVGQLSDKQIDSTLDKMSETFGTGIKYFPVGDFLTNVKSKEPNYDKDRKLVSVVTDITSNDGSVKKNLIMMKFYDKGIASFYFYAPEKMFDAAKTKFEEMVDSFGSGDIAKALPKESVKVANIKTEESGQLGSKIPIIVTIAGVIILIILIIVIVTRKKRK